MTTEHSVIPLGDGSKRASQPELDAAPVERGEVVKDVDSSPHETPYLPRQDSAHANERWQHIQATFVDDPRKSVTEASQLVSELTKRIVDAFEQERGDLERQWSSGDKVSTEELRVCLQRYRAFFSRLLPSVEGIDAH